MTKANPFLQSDHALPRAALKAGDDKLLIALSGSWTADQAQTIEPMIGSWRAAHSDTTRISLDLTDVSALDTMGAYVLGRFRLDVANDGVRAEFVGGRPEQMLLLNEVASMRKEPVRLPVRSGVISCLADIGHTVTQSGRDMVGGVSFLGEIIVALGRAIIRPKRFRGPIA
jgi:phospholipid/cholesterol/gamma-HCH transport system permease protein